MSVTAKKYNLTEEEYRKAKQSWNHYCALQGGGFLDDDAEEEYRTFEDYLSKNTPMGETLTLAPRTVKKEICNVQSN